MKQIFFLFFLSIIPLNLIAQETIPWSREKKLSWADFKAKPNEDILAYALTAYKIEIFPSDVMVDSNNNIKDYLALTIILPES